MNKRLEQKSFYEIEDRISSIIWDSKSSKNQLYATTWNGKLYTLQFNPRIWKIEMTKEPKQITESSLLSMDEDRNNAGKLLLGDDSGTVYSYNIETEKCSIVIQDKEYRPMSKVISVKGSSRIFTFSWDRTMQIWDTQSRKNVYTHTIRENIVIAEYMHPYIILVLGNNSMAFINAETYEKGSPIKEKLIEHDGLIRSLAFDASKEYLALGDIQGKVQILKKKSTDNNISSTKDKLNYNDYSVELEYEAHFSKMPALDNKPKEQKIVFPVNAICFNPRDSGFIISAGGDCSLSWLDTATQNGKRKDQYFYQREACQFSRSFTHLKFNEVGTAILTIELEHNMIEVLENPKCEYKATSTFRILKLVEDSSFE